MTMKAKLMEIKGQVVSIRTPEDARKAREAFKD